jgi:hypothetical protein
VQRGERIDGRVEDRKKRGTTMKEYLKQLGCIRRRYNALGYHIGELDPSRMTGLPFLAWSARSRIGGGRSSVSLRLGYFTIFLQTGT